MLRLHLDILILLLLDLDLNLDLICDWQQVAPLVDQRQGWTLLEESWSCIGETSDILFYQL